MTNYYINEINRHASLMSFESTIARQTENQFYNFTDEDWSNILNQISEAEVPVSVDITFFLDQMRKYSLKDYSLVARVNISGQMPFFFTPFRVLTRSSSSKEPVIDSSKSQTWTDIMIKRLGDEYREMLKDYMSHERDFKIHAIEDEYQHIIDGLASS